jgi:hypothetical protein
LPASPLVAFLLQRLFDLHQVRGQLLGLVAFLLRHLLDQRQARGQLTGELLGLVVFLLQRLLDLRQLVIAGPSRCRDRYLDMIGGLAAVEPPGGGQYHQRSGNRGDPLPRTRAVGCQ